MTTALLSAPPVIFITVALIPIVALVFAALSVWRKDFDFEERQHSLTLLVIALLILWPSIDHALSMRVSPDAVEYGVAAYRMFTLGSYDIVVHGQPLPPRYPFGFSLFILLPSFLLMPAPNPGGGILGVLFFTALGAPAAYIVGRRISSALAGWFAALLYLGLPAIWQVSQELLTYGPAAALWLIAIAFLVVRHPLSLRQIIGAATACMLAAACRPLSGLILLPILCVMLIKRQRLTLPLITSAPMLALVASYIVYNSIVFGSPFRSGYNFWCSIPYDFSSLVFGLRYITTNLTALLSTGLLILAPMAAIGIYLLRNTPPAREVIWIALTSAILLIGFHLVYFYRSPYFFLPAVVVSMPFAAVALSHLVLRSGVQVSRITLACLFIGLAVFARGWIVTRSHTRNAPLEFLRTVQDIIPNGSVLVSGLNPVFLESLWPKEKVVEVLPVSRRIEYANKVIVRKQLPELPALLDSPFDHRNAALIDNQHEDPYAAVPATDPGVLGEALAAGRAVYLDLKFTHKTEQEAIQTHFRLTRLSPILAQVQQDKTVQKVP